LDKVFKIRAHSESLELLQDMIREQKLDIGCTGGFKFKDNDFSVDIYASENEVTNLQKKILEKEISKKMSLEITDITDHLSDRLKEVGKGDRYREGKITPHGLGKKVKQ
jgi:hypothetical protein